MKSFSFIRLREKEAMSIILTTSELLKRLGTWERRIRVQNEQAGFC